MNSLFPISILLCCAGAAFAESAPDRSRSTPPAAAAESIRVMDLTDVPADDADAPAKSGDKFRSVTNQITAPELLASVVARFPREHLAIDGDLIVRKRRGVVLREFPFRMSVNWGASPSEATYAILDKEERAAQELTLTREEGKPPRMTYRVGESAAPAPDLFEPVLGTDLTWMDLTLSFLWWPGGTVMGIDRVRGYNCYVVDVPAPTNGPAVAAGKDAAVAGTGAGRPYARVRLWIEENLRVLLQAEGYDARGEAIRRLWVQSCKKINDRWMIKEMEVQGYPEIHRTKLSIRDAKAVTQP